jgi:hypothetical protein
MSDKNLLIGDTTYPHTPSLIQRWAIDPEWQHEDIEILEDDSGAWVTYKDHKDRIEQLERELAEYKKGSDAAIAYQLRAGNKIFGLNGVIDSLRVELEEAQEDLDRWNYVKQTTTAVRDGSQVVFCTPEEFESAIDAAIKEGK